MSMPHGNSSDRTPRVAIVGAGALGSELCRLIANTCQIEVLLIDPDMLEARNLPYSEMLRLGANSFLGNFHKTPFKGELILYTAANIFHRQGWHFLPMEIADVSFPLIHACDLIFSCTDSTLSRCETAWTARLLRKGMVDGGLRGEGEPSGRVSWFPPNRDAACYLCQIAESRRAEVLSYATSASPGCLAMPREAPMDAAPAIITAIAQRMLSLGLELLEQTPTGGPTICSMHATAWTYRERDGTPSAEEIAILRSASCPWHDVAEEERLLPVEPAWNLRETLQRLSREAYRDRPVVLELHWPVCMRARCRACSALCTPAKRLGWMRRRGRCEQCGSSDSLDPLDVVQTIQGDARVAGMTFEQLGFHEPQWLCFRPAYKRSETSIAAEQTKRGARR